MKKVGKREVAGKAYEVYVELPYQGDGQWVIAEDLEAEGEEGKRRVLGRGPSLKSATAQARSFLKSLEIHVEIPFTMANGRRAVARQLTRDERVTAIADDGEIVKVGRWGPVFKADTPAEVTTRLAELEAAKAELDQEERELTRKWAYQGLSRDVEREVEKRQKALDSASGK